MDEQNSGGLFKNTRSTIVFVIVAILVIAGLGLLYWANKTGKINIFGSESQPSENIHEISFDNLAAYDQYKGTENNIYLDTLPADSASSGWSSICPNGCGYFAIAKSLYGQDPGTQISGEYISVSITPQEDSAYKLSNISWGNSSNIGGNDTGIYYHNEPFDGQHWQKYIKGGTQTTINIPVKIKVVVSDVVHASVYPPAIITDLKLTFTKEATTTPEPSVSNSATVSSTPSPSSTPKPCFQEGESLGAVIPENADNKCCEGLVPVIPDGIVGTMGTCQKSVATATPESSQTPQESTTPSVTATPTETPTESPTPSATSSSTSIACTLSGLIANEDDSASYINNVSIKIGDTEITKSINGVFSFDLKDYLFHDKITVKFVAEGFDTLEKDLEDPKNNCSSSDNQIIWSILLKPNTALIVTPTPTPVPSASETPTGQNDIKYTIDKMAVSKELELSGGEKANFILFKNDANHSLEILSVTETSAQVKISSDPITINLIKNETKYVDVDNDGQKEFRLRLNSVENGKANITYEQLLTISFQSGLWLQNDAVPGSNFTVDTPGFDEGELITIVITDPDTKQVLLSQTGTVKNGQVTIKIPGDMPTGNKDLTIKSNLVPDKLVSTGINIKSKDLWIGILLGIGALIIAISTLLLMNKLKRRG